MTLNEITSSIRNRIADGLSGNISNQAFSLEQLEEEVDLQRADIINKYIISGNKMNINYIFQTIDLLPVKCLSLSDNVPCGFSVPSSGAPSVKLPPIMATIDDSAIEFFGLSNKQTEFIVYFDTDSISNHKYRQKTNSKPFIWVDTTMDENGFMTAYLLNAGPYSNIKYLSIRAIFEHPSRVNVNDPAYGDKEYPAPGHIQNAIIDALTEKYVRYYRQMNIAPLPNIQADITT